LPAAIDELLANSVVRAGLSADELSRLAAYATEVPHRADALRACGVPETLMHGDFHAGNVVINGRTIVILDWTDGCVGHPFFDMATFLPRDPVERAALLHAYLEARRPFASDEQIGQAWELAEPLSCIHHALSYMRILKAVEPSLRSELDTDVTFWLKWLRELLAAT
jgi:aminoglycoside phosphotransferase (APT) family kinase protein